MYNNCNNEYDFYYFYKSLNLLKIDFDKNLVISFLGENLLKEENNNLYSLYRMMAILIDNHTNIPDEISILFNEYKIDQGGYYITLEEKDISAMTLRSNYYGFIIENYLKTGNWINE
jgi:hypothetical protein